MKIRLMLPALTEATNPAWRPIKYSLFPPLGLATLAGYLGDGDDADIQDEHVELLRLDDDPELVVNTAFTVPAACQRRPVPRMPSKSCAAKAVECGIETATFHVLTPYPGTALHRRLSAQGRITSDDWERYDTRHAVFQPARMTGATLEAGYWRAYRDFYSWRSILRGASAHGDPIAGLRHAAYAAGWKKFEPLWDAVIRLKRAATMLPALEAILSEFGRRSNGGVDARAYGTRGGRHPLTRSGSCTTITCAGADRRAV